VAVFAAARAEGLRDESVEADEQAFAKKGEDDEEAGADADRADGLCAVGKATDHHGVDDDHAHPTDFGEDERESKTEGGAKLGAEDGEEGHGEERRYQISVIGYKATAGRRGRLGI